MIDSQNILLSVLACAFVGNLQSSTNAKNSNKDFPPKNTFVLPNSDETKFERLLISNSIFIVQTNVTIGSALLY